MDEKHFSFLDIVPPELSHTSYCVYCFEAQVAEKFEAYNQALEKAKDITIYFKNQGKETRLLKRQKEIYTVAECTDRDETLLRLAFKAVQADFNAVIDIDLISKKVRMGTYQTLIWSATGRPAHVTPDKIVRDRSIWHNPN